MMEKKISEAVIKRLPKYYRCLKEMEVDGCKKVSSFTLSEILGFTASQVRQDLSNFGGFGQQGYGYDVTYLRERIRGILGLDKTHNMIIVGGGRIGQALASYSGFKSEGFNVQAVFDIKVDAIHLDGIDVLEIEKLESYCKTHRIDIGVIATQKSSSKEVATRLVNAGITSIWNFAPCELSLGKNIVVENMNMSESLYTLAYRQKYNLKD